MEVCMYSALTDIGIAHEKAEAVVKAMNQKIDKRAEDAVNAGVNAVRADIATLGGELRSSMAALGGELRSSMAALAGDTRSSIAKLEGEMRSSNATLLGEIKRIDEKTDGLRILIEKSTAHFHWIMGFVAVVCSTVANVIFRFV